MHAGDLGLEGPECQPTFDSRRTAPVSCSTRTTYPVRTAYRIPSFLVLGVVLLGVSFLYQKARSPAG